MEQIPGAQTSRWQNAISESSDHPSDELAADATIKVAGYAESEKRIQEACEFIFGRMLTPEDFVDFLAAPNGSELLVEIDQDEDSIKLKLDYKWFNGTHDYLVYSESGLRIVEIEHVRVKANAPELLETELFARQVNSFRKFGIDQIKLDAVGYPGDPSGYVGYYFWPRVGFMMSLGSIGSQLIKAGFDYTDNTLDLFTQPGGADWWYTNGSEGSAIFYLDEDSACIQALQIYLEEKGVNVNVGRAEKAGGDPC
jgi:hypothetical protein